MAADDESSFVIFVYLELEWYQSEMRRVESQSGSQSGSGENLFEGGTSGNNPLTIRSELSVNQLSLFPMTYIIISPRSAQAGINRGDGTDFYALPGSGTSDILSLSNTSYVNMSGVWIFQVDGDEGISVGGTMIIMILKLCYCVYCYFCCC